MNSSNPVARQPHPASSGPGAGEPDLSPRKFDWLSAGQLVFSLAAALLLLGGSFLSSAVVIFSPLTSSGPVAADQLVSSLAFSIGFGIVGLLAVPSGISAGRRLFGRPDTPITAWGGFLRIGWFFPLLALLGYLVQVGPEWSRYLLPVFHVLANTGGVFWLLHLLFRRLPRPSTQRGWGALASGLTLVPLITFTLEIILLLVLVVFWLLILQNDPQIWAEIQAAVKQIQQLGGDLIYQGDLANRLLTRPGIAASLLLYLAFFVPLLEEFFKPAAVWLLAGRRLKSWEGFLIGAIAGAGYGLFENLTIGARVDDWVLVMISRLGTAAVHIFASGLVGWGAASALAGKRPGRLLGPYLAAVSLHGVWNGLNVMAALVELQAGQDQLSPFIELAAGYSPAGLVVLALGSLLGILLANQRFHRAIMAQD